MASTSEKRHIGDSWDGDSNGKTSKPLNPSNHEAKPFRWFILERSKSLGEPLHPKTWRFFGEPRQPQFQRRPSTALTSQVTTTSAWKTSNINFAHGAEERNSAHFRPQKGDLSWEPKGPPPYATWKPPGNSRPN